jgi:hypothetical protein
MKRLIFIPMLLICCGSYVGAQLPERIYYTMGKGYNKPYEWFIAQAAAWKYEIEQNRKNADAWLNYYFATGYALMKKGQNSTSTRGSITDVAIGMQQMAREQESKFSSDSARTGAILDEMGAEVPNSFEYKYLKWRRGMMSAIYTSENIRLLEDAYSTDPSRVETYPAMVKMYELRRDISMRNQMLKKWFESGDISEGLLNYNYNVLMSVEKDGFLVVFDPDQAYCLLILQNIMLTRQDISVICMDWLADDAYRKKIYTEYGIKETPFEGMDFSLLVPSRNVAGRTNINTDAFFNDLSYNKKGRAVYTTSTLAMSNSYLTNKAFLVGLAYKISDSRFDNIAVIRKNFEQSFALDYLKNGFYMEKYPDAIKELNNDYLVPMLHLYDHYTYAGEHEKADRLKELVFKISEKGDQKKRVESYLEKYKK